MPLITWMFDNYYYLSQDFVWSRNSSRSWSSSMEFVLKVCRESPETWMKSTAGCLSRRAGRCRASWPRPSPETSEWAPWAPHTLKVRQVSHNLWQGGCLNPQSHFITSLLHDWFPFKHFSCVFCPDNIFSCLKCKFTTTAQLYPDGFMTSSNNILQKSNNSSLQCFSSEHQKIEFQFVKSRVNPPHKQINQGSLTVSSVYSIQFSWEWTLL